VVLHQNTHGSLGVKRRFISSSWELIQGCVELLQEGYCVASSGPISGGSLSSRAALSSILVATGIKRAQYSHLCQVMVLEEKRLFELILHCSKAKVFERRGTFLFDGCLNCSASEGPFLVEKR
jgi:hypothetical protein